EELRRRTDYHVGLRQRSARSLDRRAEGQPVPSAPPVVGLVRSSPQPLDLDAIQGFRETTLESRIGSACVPALVQMQIGRKNRDRPAQTYELARQLEMSCAAAILRQHRKLIDPQQRRHRRTS